MGARISIGRVATQLSNLTVINEDLNDNPDNPPQNGVNTTFNTIFPASNLQVFFNGQVLVPGVDFTTSLSDNTEYTIIDPIPTVDDTVRLNYIRVG